MSRLLWMLAGLVGGISLARNAELMSDPAGAALVLLVLAGGGFCWFAAYRGKSLAVAMAEARAEARAEAHAAALSEALAQAQAQAAAMASVVVNLPSAGGERTQDAPVALAGHDAAALHGPGVPFGHPDWLPRLSSPVAIADPQEDRS